MGNTRTVKTFRKLQWRNAEMRNVVWEWFKEECFDEQTRINKNGLHKSENTGRSQESKHQRSQHGTIYGSSLLQHAHRFLWSVHLFDIAKVIGIKKKKQTKGVRKEDSGQKVLLLHT